jgi:hypothetical protein
LIVFASSSVVIVIEESELVRVSTVWRPFSESTTVGGVGGTAARLIVFVASSGVIVIEESVLVRVRALLRPFRLSTTSGGTTARLIVFVATSGVIVIEESVLVRVSTVWRPFSESTTVGGVGGTTTRLIVFVATSGVIVTDESVLVRFRSPISPSSEFTALTGVVAIASSAKVLFARSGVIVIVLAGLVSVIDDVRLFRVVTPPVCDPPPPPQEFWRPDRLILLGFFIIPKYKMSLSGLQNSWGGGDGSAAAATDLPYLEVTVESGSAGSVVGLMPGTTAGVAPAPITPALQITGLMNWSLTTLIPGMGQTAFPAVSPLDAYTQYAGVATIGMSINVDATGLAYLQSLITPTGVPPIFTFGWGVLTDAQYLKPALTVSGAALVAAGARTTVVTFSVPISTINPAELFTYMSWNLSSLTGAPAAAGWMSVAIVTLSVTPLSPYSSKIVTILPAYTQP